MSANIHIAPEQLEADIRAGTIDTVIVAFGDHQGRLIGKRTDGEFYFDVVAVDGTENCDYLIACDLDDIPIPGFRWASYEQGYGDMRGVVDPTTIRYLPWLESTAWCSSTSSTSTTARRSRCRPGASCSARWRPPPTLGYTPMIGSEVEFFLFQRALRRRQRHRLPRPDTELAVRRGLQHPPDDEGGRRARRDPARAARCRVPGRVLQGRGRARPARAQPHVPASGGDGRHQPACSRTRSRRSPLRPGGRRRSWPSRTSTTAATAATSTPACGGGTRSADGRRRRRTT